jgi:hypothetical protein
MSYNGAAKFQGPSGKAETAPWKQWFAWYPVKVHGKSKWLEKVYRRRIDWPTKYEYGNIFDLLKE